MQEATDNLIDNGRRGVAITSRDGKRPLKSLAAMLKGKSGRFRQNLLGKRVDYSGRSVIVSGPDLCMSECGLPCDMALQIFRPFLIHTLIASGVVPNTFFAKRVLQACFNAMWYLMEKFIYEHCILLNRAPTLHLLGIQAFAPVIRKGNSIKLHPLVCSGFNANFDGDQMAVHIPVFLEAQVEARYLMSPLTNLTSPVHGNIYYQALLKILLLGFIF